MGDLWVRSASGALTKPRCCRPGVPWEECGSSFAQHRRNELLPSGSVWEEKEEEEEEVLLTAWRDFINKLLSPKSPSSPRPGRRRAAAALT